MGKKNFQGVTEILNANTVETPQNTNIAGQGKIITTSYRIRADLHKKIKLAAIEMDLKEHEVLTLALTQFFSNQGKQKK